MECLLLIMSAHTPTLLASSEGMVSLIVPVESVILNMMRDQEETRGGASLDSFNCAGAELERSRIATVGINGIILYRIFAMREGLPCFADRFVDK